VPNASEYKVLRFTTQFIYTRASQMKNLNIFLSRNLLNTKGTQ